jgi:DNA-binding GntR family transcriptional regulator
VKLAARQQRGVGCHPSRLALVEGLAAVSITGHEAVIAAFENCDAEAARQAAGAHVREAGELMIAHFSDAGYWTPPGQE